MDNAITHELKLIGQGNTAEIYQYGENCILKLFRKEMPLSPIENEFRIAKIIQEQLKNVPRVMGMIEYKERHGIIYEQIQGMDMSEVLKKNIFQLNHYSKLIADIHASMHEQDIDVHYSVKDKLRRDIDSCQDLSEQEKEIIKQYIKDLPEKKQLCHFDFHPGNILVSGQTLYVIDWMTACTGDSNADVARTLLLMRTGESTNISPMIMKIIHLMMKKIEKGYLKEYTKKTGVTREEIDAWMLPVEAARLSEWLTDHERKKLVRMVREKISTIT